MIDNGLLVQMLLGALLGISVYLPLAAGQLSLATPAFYAVGGTLAALLSTRWSALGATADGRFPLPSLLLELVLGGLLAGLLALLVGRLADAGLLLVALLGYELGCVALLLLIEAMAARALQPLGGRLPPPNLAHAWRLLRWLPLTQWVYGLATLRAALARRVEWRGVHYRVRGRDVEWLEG